MNGSILVTYATRMGSTGEVANTIGDILCSEGESVDVLPVDAVTSLDGYKAVFVGSPIRVGKWLPEAVSFIENHRAALSRLPVAYFTLCLTLFENTPANYRIVADYHTALRENFPNICPLSIGMFAGKVDYSQFSQMLDLMAKAMKIPEGDFRDWAQIEAWARSVVPLINAQAQHR